MFIIITAVETVGVNHLLVYNLLMVFSSIAHLINY